MRHENVVTVLALIRDQHLPVVVLPMYPNVRQYLIRKPDVNKLHLVCTVALTSFQKFINHLQLAGMAAGLAYIHDQGMVHRRIRAVCVQLSSLTQRPVTLFQSNVLVNDGGDALLSDVGIGIIPVPPNRALIRSHDSRWMAPEVYTQGASAASDVYSFAMTVMEVCPQILLSGV